MVKLKLEPLVVSIVKAFELSSFIGLIEKLSINIEKFNGLSVELF